MGRYEQLFARLNVHKEGAFIPFVVIGDPTLDDSLDIIRALIDGGADALELGIPFSDPVADGPVIQSAGIRALAAGITPADCWAGLAQIRSEAPDIPIGLLVYANLVTAPGVEQFYAQAAGAGVDSVLVVDVPVFESQPFVRAALGAGVDPVFIAPSDADDALLEMIAERTCGYTYVLTRVGVTGTRDELHLSQNDLFSRLKRFGAEPPVVGFGISAPNHVQAALDAGAAGAISGSAVVRLVEEHEGEARLGALRAFVREMKAATLRT